jgi:hypothetical protein
MKPLLVHCFFMTIETQKNTKNNVAVVKVAAGKHIENGTLSQNLFCGTG